MSARTDHSSISAGAAGSAAASSAVVSDVERSRQGHFLGMFFLPSSQMHYDDDGDVHLLPAPTSSYSPIKAAASAASNVIGGILSVIDTALAAINEEMENSSDSISSGSSKEGECDAALRTEDSCTCVDSTSSGAIRRCSHGAKCKKLSTAVVGITNTKVSSLDNEQNSIGTSEQTRGCDNYIETNDNDSFTLQSSFLGSISTLQLLFDGESEDGTTLILSDEQPNPCNDKMEIEKQAGNIRDMIFDTESINTKQDDSEYWIVGRECEMNDGWLVVSND